jgi:hypothetical protein
MTVIALEEPDLVQEVQQITQQDKEAAQTFVAEAMRRHLATYRQQRIVAETEAWYALSSEEREQYAGQFVAVYQGHVVDTDPDRLTLYHRVHERFGRQPILLTEGGDYPIPVYHVHAVRHVT